MKVHRKISYLVYPPDFIPFGPKRYIVTRTISKARKIGFNLGRGTRINKQIEIRKGRHRILEMKRWEVIKEKSGSLQSINFGKDMELDYCSLLPKQYHNR